MKRKEIIGQIKQKQPAELRKELAGYRDKIWSLKADLAAGKVKNVREMHVVKKTIARILTVMNREKVKK